MNIELNDIERRLLLQVLSRELEELGPEIHHTRTPAYRDELKEDRRVLRALYERLAASSV